MCITLSYGKISQKFIFLCISKIFFSFLTPNPEQCVLMAETSHGECAEV